MLPKIITLLAMLYQFSALGQYANHSNKTVDSSDTYFGITYKDPYRWLENIKLPEVETWFKQQANKTDSILNNIPGRDALIAEWKMLDKIQASNTKAIKFENGRYFYCKSLAGEKVAKLYYRQGLHGKEILLFDPVTFIKDKMLSIRNALPSYDGKKIALAYSEAGAEISTIRILDVDTKKMLPESLGPTWSGAYSWTFDNKAFTYGWLRSDDKNSQDMEINSKTKIHILGTDAAKDIDYFSNESYPELKIEPSAFPEAIYIPECKDFVFAKISRVSDRRDFNYYYAPAPLHNNDIINWRVLCKRQDELLGTLEIKDKKIFAISVKNASKGKLLAVSIDNPDWDNAQVLVPEKQNLTLESICHSKDFLFLMYSDGINNHLYQYSFSTKKAVEVIAPFAGTYNIKCINETGNNCLFYAASWIKPNTEYLYNAEKNIFLPGIFNIAVKYPQAYNELVTEELLVKGHDGVMIPLSLIHKKGLKKDGKNICLIEGYAAYGESITSNFDEWENSLAIKNVIIAIAHPRGGGEYGEKWYKGGFKTTKPNSWKDFNSCAAYLVNMGYTSPGKLACLGTSAGGILLSRAITERPDLYTAAICNVGIANAMRFEITPNGPFNVSELGTVKDSIECRSLYEMDGMQHVVNGTKYPAVLCVAGWNDPRVIPWQPGKFAAALQNASRSGKPVLMKVNYNNGHFTEDKSVSISNFANQYTFILWQCGHPEFQINK